MVSRVWFEIDSLSETSSATSAKKTEPGMKNMPCSTARSSSAVADHPSGSCAQTKIPPSGRVKQEPGGSTWAIPCIMARIGMAYTARSSDVRRAQSTPSRWMAAAAWSIVEVFRSIACLTGVSICATSAGATTQLTRNPGANV